MECKQQCMIFNFDNPFTMYFTSSSNGKYLRSFISTCRSYRIRHRKAPDCCNNPTESVPDYTGICTEFSKISAVDSIVSSEILKAFRESPSPFRSIHTSPQIYLCIYDNSYSPKTI